LILAFAPSVLALTWTDSALTAANVNNLEPAGSSLILALQAPYYFTTSTSNPTLDSDDVIETRLNGDVLTVVYSKTSGISGTAINTTSNATLNTSSSAADNPLDSFVRGWVFANNEWWIATAAGLMRYNPNNGQLSILGTQTTPALSGNNVTSVTLDNTNNRLFVTSYGGGVDEISLPGLSVTSYTTSGLHPLPTSNVMHALFDPSLNVLYVSTWGDGVFVLNLNHVSSGSAESSVFSSTRRVLMGPSGFQGSAPSATSVMIETAFSNDTQNWTAWLPSTTQTLGKYAKIRAAVTTTNPAVSPSLQAFTLDYDYACGDGTLVNSCSTSLPLYCQDDGADGTLANNASVCGCPVGNYVNHTDPNICANACEDNETTAVGSCAAVNKPYLCNATGYMQYDWNTCAYCTGNVSAGTCNNAAQPQYCEPSTFTITQNASYCGCPSGQVVQGNNCATPQGGQGPPGVQITVTPPPSTGNSGGGPPSNPPAGGSGFSAPQSTASTPANLAANTPTPSPRSAALTGPATYPNTGPAEPSVAAGSIENNAPSGITGLVVGRPGSAVNWLGILALLLIVSGWAAYELKFKPRYMGLHKSDFHYWLRDKLH
jgi:hypothetical protein